jgi:hypothetical protein
MANKTRRLATGSRLLPAICLSLSVSLSAGAAAAQETQTRTLTGDPVTLVLQVLNEARLPASDLNAAEKEATAIFKAAGINTVWINPGTELADPKGDARHLTVLLLDREMAERKIIESRLGADVLGRAAHDTARAYIFTHRVAAIAAARSRFIGLVLGRVLAHELGHMVLPAQEHSEAGIMQATVDLSNRPQRFTQEQVRLIHDTITADSASRRERS